MSETLSKRFEAANGATIFYEGRELHRSLVLPVSRGDSLDLRFVRSTERPVQGFGIKCERCQVKVADTLATNVALWRDTAPSEITINVAKAKPGARILIRNYWRDEKYGTTMYYLNNAAIEIVYRADGVIVLHCSDGWLGPDFEDLVAEIRVRSATL